MTVRHATKIEMPLRCRRECRDGQQVVAACTCTVVPGREPSNAEYASARRGIATGGERGSVSDTELYRTVSSALCRIVLLHWSGACCYLIPVIGRAQKRLYLLTPLSIDVLLRTHRCRPLGRVFATSQQIPTHAYPLLLPAFPLLVQRPALQHNPSGAGFHARPKRQTHLERLERRYVYAMKPLEVSPWAWFCFTVYLTRWK